VVNLGQDKAWIIMRQIVERLAAEELTAAARPSTRIAAPATTSQ
jgi:hypothetical protein